ncbi:BPTI/Kunitz domain-containing protein [Spodoptera frugiperda]|uniref:BPTI/Kunitz domain-containing protein n=1 Tax=Spodoptera frugiperda TaxID=7108 RepID=A0A9R0D2Z0_SPOFR|nr:BPTI/Kunitz domain-containing protein [Spodoptera frugiperda]
MSLKENTVLVLHAISLLVVIEYATSKSNVKTVKTEMCLNLDKTVRAQRKSCLLRPDTGPCRADIVQWYFDAKQEKCYRFFYGGCQGNGNRYPSQSDCLDRCYVNSNLSKNPIPQFCNLAFDYGHCFGQYNRWGWDPLYKGCRRRLYSGCGGNQNNFETLSECMATCLVGPANSMTQMKTYTTCIPFTIGEV